MAVKQRPKGGPEVGMMFMKFTRSKFATVNALFAIVSTAATPITASIIMSGCLTPDSEPKKAIINDTTEALSPAAGTRAAKVFFKNANPAGSFDTPGSLGTTNQPDSGHPVSRLFNPDGSLLASSSSSSNWPKWISRIEVGISGSSNSAAKNPDCFRFATSNESATATCDWNADGTSDANCGAESGLLRTSEWDCQDSSQTASVGTGGPSDGIYIRIKLDRDPLYIKSFENLLVTLEYQASVMNPAPANPTLCFSGGIFQPTDPGCSDQSWQIFLKNGVGSVVQPFMLLVPPSFASVDRTQKKGGSGVGTMQFQVPLSSDSSIKVIQISRIQALSQGATLFTATCNPSNAASSNSALCVGMVFYSMTLFRI